MNEQGPRRVTVIDVARVAGVSAGTVSNAISGKRRVDDKTRARIEAAIAQLGYIPNLAARRMRTGRTNTIALFSSMPTAVSAGSSKLGFLMEIAASAAVAALEHNSVLALVPPVEDPVKAFQSISMDGAVIVEPEADDPVLRQLRRNGVPTVVIGGPPLAHDLRVDFDHLAVARLLIDHLLGVGCRRLVLVLGESARQTNLVFREVFEARDAALGMAAQIVEVSERDAENGARRALNGLIRAGTPFDGVLVPIDAMASGVMQALRAHGLDVPGQVRVATRYDGLRARSETPPLTAVHLHLETVATQAVETLMALIETGAAKAGIAVPAPELIARTSSAPAE